MSVLVHLLAAALISAGLARTEDICKRCECLPSVSDPTQAICRDNGSADKILYPVITEDSNSLEIVYIYGINTVNFTENSFITKKPVTMFIQNCSNVIFHDGAVGRIRTLLITDSARVLVGVQSTDDLWGVVLEDIGQLTVAAASLKANYSVSIGHVDSLMLEPSDGDDVCDENSQLGFTLFESRVKPVPEGGLSLCGSLITIKGNTFESVKEEGFRISTSRSIEIVNNNFQNITKQAFNFTSPDIRINSNHFQNLPAGALRGVSTIQDTSFTHNTIMDIDLGGVLLDMGWDMVVELNTIDCDCASKRTSILNPKKDMLYLTNSSLDKLQNIFRNNFCNLNCTVTLRDFSYALSQGDVCLTNDTVLKQEVLCSISSELDTTTSSSQTERSLVSAASRVEFLVPLGIILATILITSSLCYSCRNVNSFKYVFKPNSEIAPKVLFH